MTKYALIIEGCWCGTTHIHKLCNTMYEAILEAKDFIDEQLDYDDEKVKDAICKFAENDFQCLEDMLTIDEVEVD